MSKSEVDILPPIGRTAALGLQHVLVMYAGAVAVPLILAGAAGLTADQRALLIAADVFCCGLATLVQAYGLPFVGIRLPVMMGVTFASVSPMLAMIGAAKAGGATGADVLAGVYGSVIAAGVFALIAAPVMGRLMPFFPPIVTGTVILVIGVSLMRVGVSWAEGPATVPDVVDGVMKGMKPNPDRDSLAGLALSLFVLLVILAATRYGRGFVSNVAVLLGIVAGALLAMMLGRMPLDAVEKASWLAVVQPFQFGFPRFEILPSLTMCIVMIVVMIESTGMFLALGELTAKPVGGDDIVRGLRGDGLGTIIGGVFNAFPYTSFSQNIGLVGVTGVRSRYVAVAGGLILVVLSFLPKLAAVVASVPVQVLGGAGIVMFGMVAATGVRILGTVDFKANRNNLFVVAVSVGAGLIPLVAPTFFKNFPKELEPILNSGIILAAIVAVILNAFFNGVASREQAAQDLALAAHSAEA